VSWRDDIDELLEYAVRETRLKILIWGPGKPKRRTNRRAIRLYNKRLKMKSALAEAYPNAEVYFSEDEELSRPTEKLESIRSSIAVHARTADVIVSLAATEGPQLEIAYCRSRPEIVHKLHVFVPAKLVGTAGFLQVVLEGLRNVHGYTHREFSTCSLATERCIKLIQRFAVCNALGIAFD
jgi:hypothetical protein